MLNLPEKQRLILWRGLRDYQGNVDTLNGALGALVLAHFYGWRVVKLVHSAATMTRYERVLGFKISEVTPERTPLSKKSVGLRIADAIGSFWAYARGREGDTTRRRLFDAGDVAQKELAL